MAGIEIATGELVDKMVLVDLLARRHLEAGNRIAAEDERRGSRTGGAQSSFSYWGGYQDGYGKPLQEHHTYDETPDRG